MAYVEPTARAAGERITADVWNQDVVDNMIAIASMEAGGKVQCRLTLTTGTPVTIADVTAGTTLYLTPYGGNAISLYTVASGWAGYPLDEISINLAGLSAATQPYTNDPAAGGNITLNMTDTTKFRLGDRVRVSSSAGAEDATIVGTSHNANITVDWLALNHTTTNPLVSVALPYDVFCYYDGTPKLALVVWTKWNTRATALTTQDSVYVKDGDATWRYVGTILIDRAGGACTDSVTNRGVWNYYNRVLRPMYATHTANVALMSTSFTPVHANYNLYWVTGVEEEPIAFSSTAFIYPNSNGASSAVAVDSLTAVATGMDATASSYAQSVPMAGNVYAGIGYHWSSLLHRNDTAGKWVTTFYQMDATSSPTTVNRAALWG